VICGFVSVDLAAALGRVPLVVLSAIRLRSVAVVITLP
jgi:hypothetical protein